MPKQRLARILKDLAGAIHEEGVILLRQCRREKHRRV